MSQAHNDALVGKIGRWFTKLTIDGVTEATEYIPAFISGPQRVDWVGHSWTLKRDLLRHLFAEPQFTYDSGEDMQLSFALQQHGIETWAMSNVACGNDGTLMHRFESANRDNAPRDQLRCLLLLHGFQPIAECKDCDDVDLQRACVENLSERRYQVEQERILKNEQESTIL